MSILIKIEEINLSQAPSMLLEAQPLKEIFQKGNINMNILSNNKAHSSFIIWGISLLEKQ